MKKAFIYSILGLIILFAGIRIGASTASKKHLSEFEPMRHQNVATEIDLQVRLLSLMSDGKSADANRMLVKWLEQNVCEMGAYKQSKFFVSNTEVIASVLNAKKYVEDKKLPVGECSRKTFTSYSASLSKKQ